AMQEFDPQPDGSLALGRSVVLPVGARPVAADGYGTQFVLDAATASVLAYQYGATTDPIRLPVGPNPVALVVADFGSDRSAVIVANAGSNDLSVYPWSGGFFEPPVFGPEQRVPLGHSPSALAYSNLDLDQPGLVVAYSDTSNLTLLRPAAH